MKPRGLPPWDLTASVLVAASALALSLFPSEQITSLTGPFLFVLVLLLPGYLLSIALFPRRYDLADKGRLALSIGANILVAVILSLGLSISPWGLSPSSLAASFAVISLTMAPIAHLNRSALPRWNRFVPFISGPSRKPLEHRRKTGISRRSVVMILVLAAAVVLVAIAYTTVDTGDQEDGNEAGEAEARFTEFYIQGEKDEGHPIPVTAGSRAATVAGIINHELSAVNYTLQLARNGSILSQKKIMLDNNQSWEGPVDYVLKDPGSLVRLDFLLYKESDFSVPYSEDQLWFNVSNANMTSEKYTKTSEKSTIALEQKSKVVVLGADRDGSGDNDNKRKIAVKPQLGEETEQFSLQEMESELAESSGRKDEGSQASPENASIETATSSPTQMDEVPPDISATESDATESDVNKSETTESEEKLVATAVAIEDDNPEIDNPEIENQNVAAPEIDSSGADSSKASDPAADSEEGNSLEEADEAKEPANDDSGTQPANQEASSPGEEDKNDAPASIADTSVSQKEEADEVSEMDSEIDSWVGTRGFSKSDQSQAFKSKNIKYVKKGETGESAVLGSQSKEPLRVGR